MPATQLGNFKLRYQEILAEADAKNPVVPKSGRPGRTKQSHATNRNRSPPPMKSLLKQPVTGDNSGT